MGLTDFSPHLQVSVNGQPMQSRFYKSVSSVVVTDVAGFVSDTAQITLTNASLLSRIVMPDPGAEISVKMGYWGNFRDMGVFVVDEVEEANPPRRIVLSCAAKAQSSTPGGMAPIHQQKTRSWEAGLSLRAIAQAIAEENGLKPAISDRIAAIVPGHIDQIDESDIALLTRLAIKFDLIAKPAGAHLFVGPQAAALTASGKAMPIVPLTEREVSQWSMRRSMGEAVGTVIAVYRDLEAAQDVEVKVGDGEPVRRLRGRLSNDEEARSVAESEARRAGRAVEALELSMPGRQDLAAEGRIVPLDFSSASSGEWVINSAVHEISADAGFVTSIRAQRPGNGGTAK